ncbi:MAG: c-type cytochrome domain-containing protein [Chthoniobacter sp.]
MPSDLAQLDFFEKKIRPVLSEQCYECHSATSKKVKGGLLLDTAEGLLKAATPARRSSRASPRKACCSFP